MKAATGGGQQSLIGDSAAVRDKATNRGHHIRLSWLVSRMEMSDDAFSQQSARGQGRRPAYG